MIRHEIRYVKIGWENQQKRIASLKIYPKWPDEKVRASSLPQTVVNKTDLEKPGTLTSWFYPALLRSCKPISPIRVSNSQRPFQVEQKSPPVQQ